MQKTLLVVGAGFGQIPAIKKGRDMGLRVISLDRNPEAEGAKLADTFYEIDVLDKESILDVAREHRIDGIMTLQSDYGVPAVGFVNDKMNLHGISYETALICSNKIKCRSRLAEQKCEQPEFKIVETVDEATEAVKQIGPPCIIKPPDSSASRGVAKVNRPEEVTPAFSEAVKISNGGRLIIEEYIDGMEFGAQTFSVDGQCEVVMIHNDTLSSPPHMIPIGHSFPFGMQSDKIYRQAINDIAKAVKALGIYEGPANVDLILDEEKGRVKIIEIGARMGATCLPELVTYHSGIDWVKESINSALFERPHLEVVADQPAAALIVQAPRDGIFRGYHVQTEPDEYDILEFEITANPGDKVHKLRNGTDRIGKILARGSTAEEAENNAKRFLEKIIIEVE